MGIIVGLNSGSGSLKMSIVTSLPETGKSGQIYLVPNNSSVEGNKYDEYIWIKEENRFESLGIKEMLILDLSEIEEALDEVIAENK